jgi:hypothetical protein
MPVTSEAKAPSVPLGKYVWKSGTNWYEFRRNSVSGSKPIARKPHRSRR